MLASYGIAINSLGPADAFFVTHLDKGHKTIALDKNSAVK